MPGPLAVYRHLLDEGRLKPDPAQAAAAEKLESLARALNGYRPDSSGGWLARFGWGGKVVNSLKWRSGDGEAALPRQGLYLYGDVGRGKSMLMDMFFERAPVALKRRAHFHDFMRGVHTELFNRRAGQAGNGVDPIVRVARTIAAEAHLLCFDEFQVTDIGDAIILGRLFETLFEEGVVMVVTSNRPPRELYKDGLMRERFLPFIDIIERRLDVLELTGRQDYRLGRSAGTTVYHTGADSAIRMKADFARLSKGAPPSADYLYIAGRTWLLPRTADKVAWFAFDELCDYPRAPADYLELATLFRAVLISDIPLLGPEKRDAAKRFSTLIDVLYDHRVLLICSAAGPPEALYPHGDGAFEFQRTVSRLNEMQSADYLALDHLT